MLSDPSNGACDDLFFPNLIANCRDRIVTSVENWVTQLEDRHDECVEHASINSDPDWPYWDHSFPILQEFDFVDPPCAQDAVGCLWGAKLRPFCEITNATEDSRQTCEQAGNLPDPAADGGVDDTTGSGSEADPWGEIEERISCNTVSGYDKYCTIEIGLKLDVESNIYVFYEDDVVLTLDDFATGVTGFQVRGLDAGEDSTSLLGTLGIVSDDVITHVNSTPLDSWENALEVVKDLESTTAWDVTVRRYQCGMSGCSWLSLNHGYDTATSIDAPPGHEGAAMPGGAATSGATARGVDVESATTQGTCACVAGESRRSVHWIALSLFSVLGLRRRRSR
jgi:hypothetical protein